MATYAIGDLQGCLDEFNELLAKVDFNPLNDTLWLVGDLVNRGPDSLGVLRRIHAMADSVVTVLGNHDLHLLACGAGRELRRKDTFGDIIDAPDRDELLGWLRQQPLLHYDDTLDFALVHAGIPPQWNMAAALQAAREVEEWLRSADAEELLLNMYGKEPLRFESTHSPLDRARFTINAFTRMRYCFSDGSLELDSKEGPGTAPLGTIPWFQHPARVTRGQRIAFGHWSTLSQSEEDARQTGIFHLDTGCVWGGRLTALRLEDLSYHWVESHTKAAFD